MQSAVDVIKGAQLTALSEFVAPPAGVSILTLVSKHANVTISSAPVRGRCLIAARDIPAFSEVLTDVAAAWLPPHCDRLAATMPAFIETAPWVDAQGGATALKAILFQVCDRHSLKSNRAFN